MPKKKKSGNGRTKIWGKGQKKHLKKVGKEVAKAMKTVGGNIVKGLERALLPGITNPPKSRVKVRQNTLSPAERDLLKGTSKRWEAFMRSKGGKKKR